MIAELVVMGDSSGNSSLTDESLGAIAIAKSHKSTLRDATNGSRQDQTVDYSPFPVGKRMVGYVVTLKEDFGFVKAVEGEPSQLFFHVSEVAGQRLGEQHRDLRKLLKPGDEVEFMIEPSRNGDGKLHARRVQRLPQGTIDPEHVDYTVRRGCVRCDHNGDLYIAPTLEDAALDAVGAPIKKVKFSRRQYLRSGSKPPEIDDVVEFNIVVDRIRGSRRAKNIEVIAEAPTEESLQGRNVGHVVELSPSGGEIQPLEITGTVQFTYDSCQNSKTFQRLFHQCEVSFIPARGPGGEPMGRGIKLLPPGTIAAKTCMGTLTGRIERMPTETSLLEPDGLIAYTQNDVQSTVTFGLQDVHEFLPTLAVGDEVRFDLMRSKFTLRLTVHGVTLLLKTKQRPELGNISMLKKNFGFIKCVDRIVDVFFHIKALKETSKPLELGLDVSFLPVIDEESGKIIATELEVVPLGSAVFESLSSVHHKGTVKALPAVPQGHAEPAAGVIVALVDGRLESIPYSRADVASGDQPALNDKVSFRVLEDRRLITMSHKSSRSSVKIAPGGRRAVDVAVRAPADGTPSTSPPSMPASRYCSSSHAGVSLSHPYFFDGDASSSTVSRAQSASGQPSSEFTSRAVSFSGCEGLVSAPATTQQSANLQISREPSPTPLLPVSEANSVSASSSGKQRLRATVYRLLRKTGRSGPEGIGVLRNSSNESWCRGKGAQMREAVHPAAAFLKNKGWNLPLAPGDVVFLLQDVNAEQRESLQKQDEVEYDLEMKEVDEGDDTRFEMAVSINRTRSSRVLPANVPRWQPPFPAAAAKAATAARKAPKFSGIMSVVVPGPEKGAQGFTFGRGKPLSRPARQLDEFRFENFVTASAFIPKSASVNSMSTVDGTPRAAPLSILPMNAVVGQFEDAEE